MDRKLAATLAADVVGYSAHMERDEAGTFARLKAGREQARREMPWSLSRAAAHIRTGKLEKVRGIRQDAPIGR
jgi:hypothetical protein